MPPGRWYFSPDFGLILGSVTMIEVAPSVGYHITPQLSTGIGARYEYYRQLEPYSRNLDIETFKAGARVFARLVLIPELGDILSFLQRMSLLSYLEYETLNLETQYYGQLQNYEKDRFWYHGVLLGPGISQHVGNRSYANILVLWDINSTSSSPYVSPLIRIGAQFYFGKNGRQ
jgi:hypothetical protein